MLVCTRGRGRGPSTPLPASASLGPQGMYHVATSSAAEPSAVVEMRRECGMILEERLYEQITGGCLREVYSNVTLPAGESNLAVEELVNESVPF